MNGSAKALLSIAAGVVALESLAYIVVASLDLADDASDGAAWVMPAMAVFALVVLGCLFAPTVTHALRADRPGHDTV